MAIKQASRDRADTNDALASSLSASYAGLVAFMTVAHEGSFARAAERLGVGRSAVSRSVQKLEAQLGARLFSRTTRSTTITHEGEQFYEHCRPAVERIVQAVEEMRDLRDGPAQGQLRISAPLGFGRKVVAPLLMEFRAEFPAVGLELILEERVVDMAAERVDIAFRDGHLEDSQVVAKQIVPMQLVVCASPEYAGRHGLPASVEELAQHVCIDQRLANGRILPWEFKVDGHVRRFTPASAIVYNDPSLVLESVVGGQGIAQLPAYQVCDRLRSGELSACLGHAAPDGGGHYLCYLSRVQLPKRVRVFVDFMTRRIRSLDLECPLTASAHACPHRSAAKAGLKASDLLPDVAVRSTASRYANEATEAAILSGAS